MSNKLQADNQILGTLYIISAPSGGGKTSLVNALLQSMVNLNVSISHTTRMKRPNEQEGVNYHFVDETKFKELIAAQTFLEYATVFGHFYGTSRPWVEKKLQAGVDIILEIDWQGAEQIKKILPSSIGIFILPPSWEVLEARLRERAQDDKTTIDYRMAAAKAEISHYHDYDYLVINDDFAGALADLKAIIQARRLRKTVQEVRYAELLQNLLQ